MLRIIIIFLLAMVVVATSASAEITLVDYYGEGNVSIYGLKLYNGSSSIGVGQIFNATTGYLTRASFYMLKNGTPTGTVYARLYEVKRIDDKGYAPILATSEGVDLSTIPAYPSSPAIINFTFSGNNSPLIGNKLYTITYSFAGGNATNYLSVGYDATSPSHAGSLQTQSSSGYWVSSATFDLPFYVWENTTTDWCFQDSANISTTCGGVATGSYSCSGTFYSGYECANGYDEDWSYGIAGGWLTAPGVLDINYTKPAGATNQSIWKVDYYNCGYDLVQENLTIPAACWQQNPLQYRVIVDNSVAYGEHDDFYCFNGTDFYSLKYVNCSNDWAEVEEEAMFWRMAEKSSASSCDCPAAGDYYIGGCSVTSDCTMDGSSTLYVNGTAIINATISGFSRLINMGKYTLSIGKLLTR